MNVFINEFKHSYNINMNEISNLIKGVLTEHKIKFIMSSNSDSILFKTNADNKLFTSSVTNKIPMKEDDPRRKTLGRDYLESERLTEAQWNITHYVLTEMLSNLGIEYKIQMDEFHDGQLTELRYVKPTSFPIAKG